MISNNDLELQIRAPRGSVPTDEPEALEQGPGAEGANKAWKKTAGEIDEVAWATKQSARILILRGKFISTLICQPWWISSDSH